MISHHHPPSVCADPEQAPRNAFAGLSVLGEVLRARREEIFRRWHAEGFETAGLSQAQIVGAVQDRNQLRQVLAGLIAGLDRAGERPAVASASPLPWRDGGDDAIGKIARLRAIVMDEFLAARGLEEEIPLRERTEGVEYLISFFGDLAWQSIAAEREALLLRLQALEDTGSTLRAENQRLAQIDRSRANLTRSVTHELRNMLNAINVATMILSEEAVEDADRETFAMVRRNIGRMDELLRELLDYALLLAGRETVKSEPFNPASLFQELVATFAPLAQEKGLLLKSSCDPALPLMESDEAKVQRIATNLLSNALKYTDAGEVRISFASVSLGEWALIVEDTGEGFETDPERLFEEFYRSASHVRIRGTGLGLTITKQLVEALAGRIEVASKRGVGSRFAVFLPCHPASVGPS